MTVRSDSARIFPMAAVRSVSLFATGLVLGILVSWALGLAYLSLLELERGSLAVPLALTAVPAVILLRQHRFRWVGLGILAGAVIQTAFFIWLFAQWAGGLDGF